MPNNVLSGLRKLYIRYPVRPRPSWAQRFWVGLISVVLAPAYLLIACLYRVPGLRLRLYCARLAFRLLLKRDGVSFKTIFFLFFWPIDSTRYFEFDFIWERLSDFSPGRYLDVSSPRLFPLMLMRKRARLTTALLNPDATDLAETRHLARALGVADRCEFHQALLESAPFGSGSFDLITCISVLEHIPDASAALRKMWDFLRPGGRLYLTVPCLAQAAVQYADANLYGLQVPVEREFTFLQVYYDHALLRQTVFSITGEPSRMAIYGERREGLFRQYVERAMSNPFYPRWKDPYRMGKEFTTFGSIAELPGEGVAAMEFVKR